MKQCNRPINYSYSPRVNPNEYPTVNFNDVSTHCFVLSIGPLFAKETIFLKNNMLN